MVTVVNILRIITVEILSLLIRPNCVNGCLSTGVCIGSACCGGGSCQTPIPCVQSSCQTGYSCGMFGCARNRVRSALTQRDGVIVPIDQFLNSTKNPNYLFRQCCEDRQLPDACIKKCHFNAYTRQTLQNMFFKNDACPIEAAADLQYCAAQGRDHIPCCIRSGIHTTLAGNKCLTFCDQRVNRVTKLDYSFLPCYDRFESMKRCFYDEIKQRMKRVYGENFSITEKL